jgi:hypothetical protein
MVELDAEIYWNNAYNGKKAAFEITGKIIRFWLNVKFLSTS